MEWLNNLPVVQQAVVWVIALNTFLYGLKSAVDMIKDKTASQVDNKLAAALGKVLGVISKVLDIVGMNPAHK